MRRIILVIVAPFSAATAHADATRELTPDQKSRLFSPSVDVRLNSNVVQIPMRGTDHAGNAKCPYFQVYVNGKGPFTFLYDTGATYMSVSTTVVAAAGAKIVVDRAGRRNVVALARLSIGGVEVRNAWAIEDDSWRVDGVIGFPTLGDANVLFDLVSRKMFVSRQPIPMPRSFTLPLDREIPVPAVPVGIGSRVVPVAIDTGDDAYALELRSIDLGNAAFAYPPTSAGTVMNGTTKQRTAVTVLWEPVTLGPLRVLRPEIAINDDLPVSDFGYDALRQFRVQIDPKRRTATFQLIARRLTVAAHKRAK
jgi:hypothetical protein